MKKFVKVLAVSVLTSSFALAQSSGLDSPHNYKRPAVQQKPQAGLVVKQGNFQNNISSVHNYKRQNNQNLAQESSLVLNVPVLKAPVLNPLYSPNHYKIHYRPIIGIEEYAQRKAVAKPVQVSK